MFQAEKFKAARVYVATSFPSPKVSPLAENFYTDSLIRDAGHRSGEFVRLGNLKQEVAKTPT